jgi:sarcosine oxidase
MVQTDTGIVHANLAVNVLQDLARKHGAVLLEKTAVTDISSENDFVIVKTQNGSYRSLKLIIAAGGWIGSLCQSLGLSLPVRVTHEQYALFQPLVPEMFEIGKFPIFINPRHATTESRYGFPIFKKPGVKVAFETAPGFQTTPDRPFPDIDKKRLAELKDYVQDVLPDAYGEILEVKSCLYTRTPDDHFIIDYLPGNKSIVIASPCSGHGFKFISVIGRMLADMAQHRQTHFPIDLFSIARFGNEKDKSTKTRWD